MNRKEAALVAGASILGIAYLASKAGEAVSPKKPAPGAKAEAGITGIEVY